VTGASGRALADGRAVRSDDERADHGVGYVGVGLLSFLLIAVALAAFVLPPAFGAGFILRGRPALRIVGYGLIAAWMVGLLAVGRRVMGAAPRSDDE
jgi:hypothetical protein